MAVSLEILVSLPSERLCICPPTSWRYRNCIIIITVLIGFFVFIIDFLGTKYIIISVLSLLMLLLQLCFIVIHHALLCSQCVC